MIKKILIGLVMVMFMVSGAHALDQSACDNFPHTWGDDTVCLGLYELDDMGAFNEGVWQWHDSFLNDPHMNHSGSGWQGDFDQLIPIINTTVNVDEVRLDNRNHPLEADVHRVVFGATKGGISYPQIWKMEVGPESGWNCTDSITQEPEMCLISHADGYDDPRCNGWNDDIGGFNNPDCNWGSGQEPPVIDSWAGPMYITVGATILGVDDIASFEVNGNIVTPRYLEIDNYNFLRWQTDRNAFRADGFKSYSAVYSNMISGLIPVGDYIIKTTLISGQVIETPMAVISDRIMPTVLAKSYYTDLVVDESKKGNKSKKKVKATEVEVEIDNITARELDGQLIIQWAEPDGAFQPPIYLGLNQWNEHWFQSIRLRIFVGNGWLAGTTQGGTWSIDFLWIDAPVHSGTVVVPANEWAEIKSMMIAKGLSAVDIGGQYREQLGKDIDGTWVTYHNRGYIEGIKFSF